MRRAAICFIAMVCLMAGSTWAQQPAGRVRAKQVLVKVAHAVANHVTLDIATGASSGFAAGGTFYCRSHNPDVEGCTEHYGSAAGGEIARGVFTGAMIALSEYGRKQGFKEWFVPAVGTLAFNTFWGARQFTTHERPEFHRPERDK